MIALKQTIARIDMAVLLWRFPFVAKGYVGRDVRS